MYNPYNQRYRTELESSRGKLNSLGRTEFQSHRLTRNTKSAILPTQDLPYLVEDMGNISLKTVTEKSPIRRKSSSSNSVSRQGKRSDNFEHGVVSSDPKFAGKSLYDPTLNTNDKLRRNSSDSGYNSSGKVCETRTGTGSSNGLQRLNLYDNKSCGKSDYSQIINKNKPYTSDCTSLSPNKPELCKNTAVSGSREILPGRSSSRTSLDLDNTKPRSYVNDRSILPKSPMSASEGLVGLQNLGNTCFMNSILQCLSHCWPLRDRMLSGDSLQYNRQSKMKGKLSIAFADLIKAMWSKNRTNTAVSPHSFKMQIQRFSPRFVGYEQQDSQEFLRFLLEGLNEDLNLVVNTARRSSRLSPDLNKLSEKELSDHMWKQYKSRDNSLITDLFCGQIMSTLTCTKCNHRSVTYDPFWDLSLSIPRNPYSSYSSSRFTGSSVTLSECLKLFTQEEDLDGDEKPKCEKCKTRQKCQKQIKIHRFPRILVIHLKRFSGFGFRSKLQTDVDFPLNHLDMSNFASKYSHEFSSKDSSCVKYNLFAVSNHSGSAFGGHYTAYCKHPESKEWHSFNDSRVGALSSSSVRGSQAYVLFYERDERDES
ncbi:Ubiquitin carboxyl-terminal hydrolase 2 [Paramuricea clavata]|uniref:Ubiquitin carboxyl-terminal hydrolase n=1 Tax=Paramuricea clavata TaxID=317549 RepID=A0A6S7FFC7_PARCT|nr:Ubiquitin carboxyl-terminal hydrolase 2 [Paramuricea clavata]